MKANLLLLILIIGFNSSLVAQTSQVITDSVTINGRVTDYDNHPLDNVSVSWARPDFSEVSVTLTDKNGNYSIRIPKGKYHSMGALNMDEIHHRQFYPTGEGSTTGILGMGLSPIATQRSTYNIIVWKPMDCVLSESRVQHLLIRCMSVL